MLNIWGEWCSPCIQEIPTLREEYFKYSSQVEFVSLIKTHNLDQAKRVIQEQNVFWPQSIMSEDLEWNLKVTSYPTNILIYPDGKSCIISGQINENFLKKNVQ